MPADLLDIVGDPRAEQDLRRYFAENSPRPYSGRRFETLGGGGDRAETRDVITADDLVAVQMLSVRVPAETAIGLLDGDLGPRISALLKDIDTDVELGTDSAASLIVEGSAAYRAWTLLDAQHDVGYVIAGKLMARKRPRLIPVYDQVVRCQFGGPGDVWLGLHDRLAANGGALRHDLAGLHARADVPAAVHVLRVLDVVMWMRHYRQHRRKACPGFATVSLR